jgi:hypothetical protein
MVDEAFAEAEGRQEEAAVVEYRQGRDPPGSLLCRQWLLLLFFFFSASFLHGIKDGIYRYMWDCVCVS